MKTARYPAFFVSILLILALLTPVDALAAAGKTIDTSTVSDGYFTVSYETANPVKMKVAVTEGGETVYYNYTPGDTSAYALMLGDGSYTITLYRNTTGTKYKKVQSASVNVQMESPLAPYLVSTDEITFSDEDAVGLKAAELCEGLTTDEAKIVAIHNYIAANYVYDYDLAYQITSGAITTYSPDTAAVLETDRGICYDFSSLFAAMCRSQDIPCAIAKGYLNGGYHAWNMVYINDQWQAIDMTREIAYHNAYAWFLQNCVTALDNYSDYTF